MVSYSINIVSFFKSEAHFLSIHCGFCGKNATDVKSSIPCLVLYITNRGALALLTSSTIVFHVLMLFVFLKIDRQSESVKFNIYAGLQLSGVSVCCLRNQE